MTEGQTLFLILGLLYLSDCVVWIGRRTVLFLSPWCRNWRVKHANHLAGNENGSLMVLNPLPPLGAAFAGRWLPVSISPIGVCDFTLQTVNGTTRPPQSGNRLLYEQIEEVRSDGKHLLVNGTRFAKCESPEQAESLAGLIKTVRREPLENREKIIRENTHASFSKAGVVARLEEVNAIVPDVRWSGMMFFAFLYVLVPILVSAYGLIRFVIPVALLMLVAASITAFQYFRAHRKLYLVRKGERVSNTVKMVLCPPVAIRAADLLSLESLSVFSPAILAAVLLEPVAADFLRPVIRDLQNPLRHEQTDPDTLSIASWYAALQRDAITNLLKSEALPPFDNFLLPPECDGSSTTYCPRCACQFTVLSGECPDCPGVILQSFSVPSKAGVQDVGR